LNEDFQAKKTGESLSPVFVSLDQR